MALQHTPETQALLDAAIAQIPGLPTCRRGKDVNGNVSNGLGKRTRNAIAKILGLEDATEVWKLVQPYYLAVHARRVALNPEVWNPAPKASCPLIDTEREELLLRTDARIAELRGEGK